MDCIKYSREYEVELLFDGKSVPMVPFVEEIVENVVVGLAKSLDGFEPDTEIKIILSPKQNRRQGG